MPQDNQPNQLPPSRKHLIPAYLHPTDKELVVFYAKDNEISISKAVESMAQEFFNDHPEVKARFEQRQGNRW